MIDKKECPCCKNLTLESSGNFEICPVCFWEDDPVQSDDTWLSGGANRVCLELAKFTYFVTGCSDTKFRLFVRKPLEEELNTDKREIL